MACRGVETNKVRNHCPDERVYWGAGYPVAEEYDSAMSSMQPITLAQGLNSRDNALNAIRLVLASLVILSHSGLILSVGWFPDWIVRLGPWAVASFFIISGYLIAGSREHLDFKRFLIRRVARIYPGFWVQLILVATVAAPLAKLAGAGDFSLSQAASFFWKNASLYILQWNIGTTPAAEAVWNGSLWTLFYEFSAYLAVGVIFGIPWVRKRGAKVAASLAIGAYAVHPLAGPLNITTALYLNAAKLASFFLMGVLAYYLRHRIPVRRDYAVVAAALVVSIFLFGDLHYWAHVPLTYLLLAGGVLWRARTGADNDISYGVYIYACPIQHLLGIYCGAAAWGFLLAALVCLAVTVPMAWASWILIERPALRWARSVTRWQKTVSAKSNVNRGPG